MPSFTRHWALLAVVWVFSFVGLLPAADLAAPALSLPEGFTAEVVHRVAEGQGSWVALTVDGKGRLIASDQNGGLFRVTLGETTLVEPVPAKISQAQGLLWAFDSLYVMVNGKNPGLYRVRDSNGDDQLDEVTLLRAIQGAGEHGPHAVVLSPDGKSLYLVCGNHTNLPSPEDSRVPRLWDEDHLLPRMWDARGHARGKLAPGGFVCRTDPEGKHFELISIGYRNTYDIAFSPEGELFGFDSDMEWDIGAPWYRPTRVNHITSGSEFGWRSGTGKWPEYYPDSLGSVVDIGPGSPTGVAFGTGAKFPEKYQRALFICDWSYGKIYAVDLKPEGSTFTGTAEQFAAGAPLPVTDLLIHPDGAMYFAVGGRGTASALYRVRYTGSESTEAISYPPPTGPEAELRRLRRELEAFHGKVDPQAVEAAWPYLKHDDRAIRFAARVAVEHQPVNRWRDRVLAETEPTALLQGIVALARCSAGKAEERPAMLAALARLPWGELSESQRLDLLRAYSLVFTRTGEPSEGERREVLKHLDSHYPADSEFVNRELSLLLVYLNAPGVAERTLALQARAPSQEEQLHYAFVLRALPTEGWNLELRRRYFSWFARAGNARGGASFGGFLDNIRNEALASVSEGEKEALAEVLRAQPITDPYASIKRREFVRDWSVDELADAADTALRNRDFERGRQVFSDALCFRCHRFAGAGGITGPDLTAVGGRFGNRDLLEAILEPSKVVSDQYQSIRVVTVDGKVYTGRIANMAGERVSLMTDMLNPGAFTNLQRNEIEEILPNPTSMMPEDLLNNFTREEIFDLLAYLRSGGDPGHALFRE